MKRKLLLLTFGTLTLISCSDAETKKQLSELKIELEQAKAELNNCSADLTEIKNTAENRFIRAKKLLSENNLNSAKTEFQGIIDNFKGNNDATIALKEIE
ncbi:MAG: hypothetical protein O2796_06800 [Bacteroidetes bacterium]|nr:hypothetical protein [Bacteroidota bacterium]MDA0880084.1 hypothetical protein [Bacteroidota bacterium]MDA1115992.1 hypothetical protein [Bacteroidota bacterium]